MPWILLLHILIFMFVLMSALWLYQWKTNNATIVDVGWAVGMGVSSVYLAIETQGNEHMRVLACCLLVLWSMRLSFHLATTRLFFNQKEDMRYQTMRASMGKNANLGFFLLFQSQSLFVLLFMAPILILFSQTDPLWQWQDKLGVICWAVAIIGESIADQQLHNFRSKPENHGKTCQSGLWNYSRHPNYFFEWLHWFAYPLLAWGGTDWLWTWTLPATMLLFLWKITGIPYNEAEALKHRSDYAAYQKTTSILIPWFKRKPS